ncbi:MULTISPECIES: type II toxin-antitoxin system RelE family toxin [Alicyclobacillus]|uniref:mRNA interferase RelE/StbE n=1 Tax=Alicyclobacillus vulcanalis TaxID=252246 RepID=A0A1N7PK40_9BACL|nr:mRNA interferase RelE/StbE [Alicyclobacillus vulcanalis]
MKLRITKSAKDFLSELQPKTFRQVVMRILDLLSNPYPHDAKQLKGYDYFRVDIGEYRIIYSVADDEIHVLLVGKRNDDEIYRRLKRKEH